MLAMLFIFFWQYAMCYMLSNALFLITHTCFTLSVGDPPLPLTPDYGAPDVSYADGVFDPHFSRYVTVMEGTRPIILF